MLQFDTNVEKSARIKVIGVGGGGTNAVNWMMETGFEGVDFIAVNTDRQALNKSNAETKIQIGERITKGLGAGSNPQIGQMAAEETLDEIVAAFDGADMVFVTAGMGGGTGTGASPIIAKAAKDAGILTIAVVTKPFNFEGAKKRKQAELGISFLKQYVDAIVIIPNEKLIENSQEDTTLLEAFAMSNDVLKQGVQGIANLISEYAFVNLDFADVRTAMLDKGIAHMGIGSGVGENRVEDAVKSAIDSPLLETKIRGAKSVLLYIAGGYDLGMREVEKIASSIQSQVDEDCVFKFGACITEDMANEVRVTVVATGFDEGLGNGEGYGLSNEKKEQQKPKSEEPAQEVVYGNVDGVEGKEVELSELFKQAEDEKEESRFEIPSFL